MKNGTEKIEGKRERISRIKLERMKSFDLGARSIPLEKRKQELH